MPEEGRAQTQAGPASNASSHSLRLPISNPHPTLHPMRAMRANCLLLVAGLLAIMVVADAKVCGTKGAKTFRIKKNK